MLAYNDLGVPDGNVGLMLAKWVLASSGENFCKRLDLANRMYWRMPISVSLYKQTGLYLVEDDNGAAAGPPGQIVIGRPERVFRYRRGVAKRVHKLARKYMMDQVPLADGDVVID